jgi:uncharacterized protein with HEPN domain
MNESDLFRLKHMRDAAREALAYIEGLDREALDENSMLSRALTMCIGIIGEASARISDETKEANLQIPWRQITGMRNRLIHAYFDIDLDRVWSTVNEDLPILLGELAKILPETDESGSETL